MSLQWFKPTTIALTPESITINSGAKDIRTIDVPPSSAGKSSLGHVLAEFENFTASITAKNIKFIISNQYVRYGVLPWQADVYSQQDWQSLAENHLTEIHGNVVASWKVSVAMQGFGKPLLVSAVDLHVIAQLETLAEQNSWEIESIEPALVTISNHHHKLRNNDWLMMIEPQHAILMKMFKGRVNEISIISPQKGQESVESEKLIKRSLLLQSEVSPKAIYLFGESILLPNMLVDNIKITPLLVNQELKEMRIILASQR